MNRYVFASEDVYYECLHCHKLVEHKDAAFIHWHNEAGSKGVFTSHKGECEASVHEGMAG